MGWVVSSYKRFGSLARFVQDRSRYTGRVNEFAQYVWGGAMGVILIVIIIVYLSVVLDSVNSRYNPFSRLLVEGEFR